MCVCVCVCIYIYIHTNAVYTCTHDLHVCNDNCNHDNHSHHNKSYSRMLDLYHTLKRRSDQDQSLDRLIEVSSSSFAMRQ